MIHPETAEMDVEIDGKMVRRPYTVRNFYGGAVDTRNRIFEEMVPEIRPGEMAVRTIAGHVRIVRIGPA